MSLVLLAIQHPRSVEDLIFELSRAIYHRDRNHNMQQQLAVLINRLSFLKDVLLKSVRLSKSFTRPKTEED